MYCNMYCMIQKLEMFQYNWCVSAKGESQVSKINEKVQATIQRLNFLDAKIRLRS